MARRRRKHKKSLEDEAADVAVAVVLVLLAALIIWSKIKGPVTSFWKEYGTLINTGAFFILLLGGIGYLKVVRPARMKKIRELEKKKELEKNIIRKRLLKERKNELKGLNEEEKEFLLSKWIEEEYDRGAILRGRSKKTRIVRPLTSRETADLIDKVGSMCENPNCNRTLNLEVHHIIPRSEGGSNRYDNLIVLCRNCHADAQSGGYSRELLKKWIKRRNFKKDR
jgi:5-methylcytosine-specific restriction endonuclease McrA/preprotein translocase subunit Sss1